MKPKPDVSAKTKYRKMKIELTLEQRGKVNMPITYRQPSVSMVSLHLGIQPTREHSVIRITTEKCPHVSGPMQFESTLFKSNS